MKEVAIIIGIVGGVCLVMVGLLKMSEYRAAERVRAYTAERDELYRKDPDLSPARREQLTRACVAAGGIPVLTGRFVGDYTRIRCAEAAK